MSFVDRRLEIRPTRGEAPFKLNEVFFSRTDDVGTILASNHVFTRVANYDWEEMQGAPHNLIRHPDMPRGVFWLLWNTLKRGRSMGAYVKNQAKDGLYYWVFAVITPCEGGYLSARIKPTSPMFATIEVEYAALRKRELEEDLDPEESAELLLGRLRDLGFEKYHQFAAHALCEELLARDTGLGNAPDPKISDFRSRLKNATSLLEETESLVQEFDAMRTIPHNLRVIASRIEPAGGPVTVLSQNYGTMSQEMSDWFATHVMGEDSNFAAIKGTINHSLFVECLCRILSECNFQLTSEQRQLDGVDIVHESALVTKLISQQANQAEIGLQEVNVEAERILSACKVMHRHFLGLSSTRVLCKIESARLSEEGDALTGIIDQLGIFQERISKQLERIAHLGNAIKSSDK